MQVYRIYNKKNNKSYIGITIWDFNTRYNNGKWWKWTHSLHLKSAVKNYGLENFTMEILNNSCETEEQLNELERLYIKQYNSLVPNGYNLTIGGSKMAKPTLTKEYELIDYNGNLYKINNLSEFCHKNKLSYGAMLNMVCGINKCSQGFTLSSNPIEYIKKHPNEEFEIENINNGKTFVLLRKNVLIFCEENNLKSNLFWLLLGGKKLLYDNFKLKSTVIPENYTLDRVKYKETKLVHRNGEKLVINNIYKFCEENKEYSRSGFYDLINGQAFEYQGWRLDGDYDEFIKNRWKNYGKVIKIRNIQTNEIFEIKNISEFCRQNNIDLGNFNTMVHHRIKQYMGFCLPETDLTNYKFPKWICYLSLINLKKEIIEGENAKDIQKRFKIASSQSVQNLINNKLKECKGWKVLRVKYAYNFYPEIDNRKLYNIS